MCLTLRHMAEPVIQLVRSVVPDEDWHTMFLAVLKGPVLYKV
jgi:hypothetical protein